MRTHDTIQHPRPHGTIQHPRPHGWTQNLHALLEDRPDLAGVGITALPIWGQA